MDRSALGDRMKNYESVSKVRLMKRTPVILRLDGKAFHTFTKGFKKPFDPILIDTMQETTVWLHQNIQGCIASYTQSDEITLVLVDYQNINTSAWFDYEVQKMCSIAASMATMKFNQVFNLKVQQYIFDCHASFVPQSMDVQREINKYIDTLRGACARGAMFDARCFNIPKEEVANCLLWRIQDCERNSIQSCGQANFSHKELQGKSCHEIVEMLKRKDFHWDKMINTRKYGSLYIGKRGNMDNLIIEKSYQYINNLLKPYLYYSGE